MSARLVAGYMPLVDAAPLIVARDMGFARAEGLDLDLRAATSWSALRDMLRFGMVDAAHMLAPVPVATALGLGGAGGRLQALSVLSVDGNIIGVSRALAARMRAGGHGFGFDDPGAAALALRAARAAEAPLRIGVPFPFSMHAELLRCWLGMPEAGGDRGVEIRTVPPPLVARALEAGEIDAFCVGEPWGSIAVEREAGELLLPGRAIRAGVPEKVLAMREGAAEAAPEATAALLRALWHAGRWLSRAETRVTAAELLARPDRLDLPAELCDRALSGRFVIDPSGTQRERPGFVRFDPVRGGAPLPDLAAWLARRMAARSGQDGDAAAQAAGAVFREALHGAALGLAPRDAAQGTTPGQFFDMDPAER